MWIDLDGYVYEGDRQLRGVDENDQPIYDPEAPSRPSPSHVWAFLSQSWVIPPPDIEAIIGQVSALLQYAQAQSAGDPFPLERQEEIFDLVGRIENYLRKGAFSLALARANAFDVAGWEDLNEGQQTLATALKNQILALLPTP